MLYMIFITAIMNKLDMIHGWWLFVLILGWVYASFKIILEMVQVALRKE